MPASFLKRHRTICMVLEEIRGYRNYIKTEDERIRLGELVDEAKDYAQRMSAKLVEYKNKEKER